jgi:hypothetical protein
MVVGKALSGDALVGCVVVDRLARGVRQPIAAIRFAHTHRAFLIRFRKIFRRFRRLTRTKFVRADGLNVRARIFRDKSSGIVEFSIHRRERQFTEAKVSGEVVLPFLASALRLARQACSIACAGVPRSL